MLVVDSRTSGDVSALSTRINQIPYRDSLLFPRGDAMAKYENLAVDSTQPRTGPVPPLGDPVWDVADLGEDVLLSVSSLSLRHAREHLRICVAYQDKRVPHTEFARRLRRALTLINDALENIS